MKASGKRDDVTALLLYAKGQQLLDPEQFERLTDEMAKLDVEVAMKGATCTLSNTSEKLESDGGTLVKMYVALATVPTLIGLVPYVGATVFGVDVPPAFGLASPPPWPGAHGEDHGVHQPAERGDSHGPVPVLRG